MPGTSQANRLMQFDSPAGQDVLVIETFQGTEGVSRLFEYQVDLLADAGANVDPTTLVGNKATVTLNLLDVQGTRYFNGIVAHFEQTQGDTDYDVYRVYLKPSLWQLTLATNCRVFQDMAVMDVIKAVISPYALSVGDVTSRSYKPMEYCTQYNETDFNFISRLAEQYGIFYWFEHTDGDNKVVFGDMLEAYTECPTVSSVQYSPQEEDDEVLYHSVISDFRVTATMVTGKHSARDYDFRGYSATQNGPTESAALAGTNAFEWYEFVSGESAFVKKTDTEVESKAFGNGFIDSQKDASDADSVVYSGTGTARSFVPGFTFTLTDHTRDEWNQGYFLTEVAHHAVQAPPYRGDSQMVRVPYTNRFTGLVSTQIFRPEVTTPKPIAHGPQTAKVVTSPGDDLYIDKYGRVCVQFFWDRERQPETPDNTWVRVGQPWAGSGWGTYIWPRVNDEVIIHFLHGDPDEPICVGSVYNGTNMPKYTLPDMATRTGIVTRSSLGGSSDDFNELRFEDKTGDEQIFLNAQKDMDHRVENDLRTYVMAQDSLIVDKDQLEKIGGNYNRQIVGDSVEKIGGKQDLNIVGAVNHQYGAAHGLSVASDSITKIGGKQDLKTGDAVSHEYGGKYSLKISGDHAEKNTNYATESDMSVYIKGGMTVVIEAGMQLSLKAAGSFIDIGPAGVAISGTMVLINSGGAAGSGSAPDPTAPGSPTPPSDPKDPDTADDGSKGTKM